MNKRNKQKQRLEAAKDWIPTYQGNIVRGYQKQFKLSTADTLNDLSLLGFENNDQYKKAYWRDYQKQRRKNMKSGQFFEEIEQNENFYFIAGYTDGGAPYGITWEEAKAGGLLDKQNKNVQNDDDLPF